MSYTNQYSSVCKCLFLSSMVVTNNILNTKISSRLFASILISCLQISSFLQMEFLKDNHWTRKMSLSKFDLTQQKLSPKTSTVINKSSRNLISFNLCISIIRQFVFALFVKKPLLSELFYIIKFVCLLSMKQILLSILIITTYLFLQYL